MELEEGKLFDGRFLLKEWIGAGSYGEVWLAVDTQTDVEVAIKIYVSMDSKGLEDFKKEFKVSFDLNHTNLLHANFLEVCREDQRPYLVMPFCPNGSVMKTIGEMPESEIWKYIRDVSSGLAYLHSQVPPIIHQDIKPDNILLTKNGEYVITDFGISQQARSTLRRSVKHLSSAGSVAYMGPERYGKDYHAIKASDIWSFGVTIFEVAMGELPFCGLGGSMQRQGAEIPDLSDNFSEDLNKVMQSCLAKETWDRPTAEMLADYAAQKVAGRDIPIPWLKDEEPEQNVQSKQQSVADSSIRNSNEGNAVPEIKEADSDKGTLLLNRKSASSKKEQTDLKQSVESRDSDEGTIINKETPKPRGIKWYVWLLCIILGLGLGAALNFFNII